MVFLAISLLFSRMRPAKRLVSLMVDYQAGLTSTVAPEQCEDLVARHLEADVVQDLAAIVEAVEVG